MGIPIAKTKAFISFDYDHDETLEEFLIGQAKLKTPFRNIRLARIRIKGVDVLAVICGELTDSATGVSAEIEIAQEDRLMGERFE